MANAEDRRTKTVYAAAFAGGKDQASWCRRSVLRRAAHIVTSRIGAAWVGHSPSDSDNRFRYPPAAFSETDL